MNLVIAWRYNISLALYLYGVKCAAAGKRKFHLNTTQETQVGIKSILKINEERKLEKENKLPMALPLCVNRRAVKTDVIK